MARTDPQFNLRIPLDLKAKVEEAAKANGRSATSEILARLESSFSTPPSTDDAIEKLQGILWQAVEKLADDGLIRIVADEDHP